MKRKECKIYAREAVVHYVRVPLWMKNVQVGDMQEIMLGGVLWCGVKGTEYSKQGKGVRNTTMNNYYLIKK